MSKGFKFEQGAPVDVSGGIDGVKAPMKPLSTTLSNERQTIRSTPLSAPKPTSKRSALFTSIFGKDVADQLEKTGTASREKEMEPQEDMYDDIDARGEMLPEETIVELRKKYLVHEENKESSTDDDEFVTGEGEDLPEGVIQQLRKNYKVETEDTGGQVSVEEHLAQVQEDEQIAKNAKKITLSEEHIDQTQEVKKIDEGVENIVAESRKTGEEKGLESEEFDEFDEPERRSAEEQMLGEYSGANSVFQETSADSASAEEVQKNESTVVQEAERDVTNEIWKEDKEQYVAYRREVRKAKKAFFDKTEAYEKEKKEAGMMARFLMTAPKLAETKEEMLNAQKEYDEKLVAWRDRRGDILESFSKRQNSRLEEGSTSAKEKERIEKKNKERGEGYVNYIARREAILEHHIDNEVSELESLRYNENEKGESKNKAVRFVKAKWNWYRALPPKKKLLYGIGFSGLIGVTAGATGLAAGGALLAGGAFAGRRAVGGLVGAFAGLKTKELGDLVVETMGDNALQKQHESFGKEDLGTSREKRRDIRRKVRFGKDWVSTGVAAGVGISLGMKATEAAASVADVFGNTGHSTFGAKNAHAGTVPQGSGSWGDSKMTNTSHSVSMNENVMGAQVGGNEITPDSTPQSISKNENVFGKPVDTPELKTAPDSFSKNENVIGVQRDGNQVSPDSTPQSISKNENVFGKNIDTSEIKTAPDSFSKNENVMGGVDTTPQEDVHFGGVDIKVPEGPQEDVHFGGVDIKVPEGPQNAEIQDILKAHGIGTEDVEMKGVYEAGSSVQRELQEFLKDNPSVQEKYPNLTDVERGKIAHLMQLELAKDPAMLEEFKVRGGDWSKVLKDDTYSVKLNTDLLTEQIEKVHPTVSPPQTEIPNVGNSVSEQIDTQSVPQKDVHFGGVDIKVPEGVQEDVHFGGVDIKVPEVPQEDVHFGGVDIKVPEDTSSTADSFSKNENAFGRNIDTSEIKTAPESFSKNENVFGKNIDTSEIKTAPDSFSKNENVMGGVDTTPQEDVHFGGVDIKVPEAPQEDVHFGGVDIKVPEDATTTADSFSKNENVFGKPVDINEVPKEPTPMPKSANVFPNTHMPESGDVAVSPTTEASVPDLHKDIEMKGVYEAGSSVVRELQDFLKDSSWIQEKYPNLTDVERGTIAQLIQQELAKDPAMLEEFKVRGGDWSNVLKGDTYAVKLNADVLAEQIEKVHPTGSVGSAVHTGEEAVQDVPKHIKAEQFKILTDTPVEPEHITAEQSKIHNDISQEFDPSKNVDTDLAQAQKIIEKSGPDYLGIQTRPAIESLFKNGVFNASILQGQKPLILSYWGAISHVRLQDMYDFDKELTYTIGGNAPVRMGEHVESLTVALVHKMETALANKIPDIQELISESQRANETIGELVQKIQGKLEASDSAPVVPTDIPSEGGEVGQSPTVEVPVETAPAEPVPAKPEALEVPSIEKTPLSEYSSVTPALQEQSTRGILGFALEKTWNAKLVPIEVESTIKNLVQQRYPDANMWPSGNAEEVLQKSANFRSAVERHLIDIRTELNPDNAVDFKKIFVDVSAYNDMTPTEMLEQLEQHASMLRKANVSIPDNAEVIKTQRF